ncbi:MAG: hypothetical protein IB618_00765 [Candidatus Pacearchaeota archaeon]|nr:MAG: hypothetical protein IB618_00765 [Candidatus Pacearchaeota archaeon]
MNGQIKRYTAYKISAGLIAKGNIQLETDKNDPTKQRFRFLTLDNKEINRINLIANVIDTFRSNEKNYITLTLDDGTGQIRVRAFSDNIKLLENNQPGDTILIIGTLRYFNNEIYILPEIVKQLNVKWLLVRKLELEKEYGELYKNLEQPTQLQAQPKSEPVPQPNPEPIPSPEISKTTTQQEPVIEKPEIKEEKIETTEQKQDKELGVREKIIEIINAAEAEEGVNIDKIIMQLNSYKVEEINNKITELLEEGTIYEPKPGRLRIL